MTKLLLPLLALGAAALASCQPAANTATSTPPPAEAAPAATAAMATPAPDEASARAAVARYIQTLPNATLYVPDSARVNDNEATWQVLVPRTDWAKRMPNRARFEVDKQTGQVSSQPVK
jgi:hypothetical protein